MAVLSFWTPWPLIQICIKAGGPSRTFYDKKRGERLIHTQALLALARRLVDVLWALLRDGRSFTPTAPPPATQAA
ncbi:hypothetical protein GCM10009533_71240 [Saccharopolyspora spinosporotrichia]|uniref:Transposase n=1 Tax=Saccharopolyspora erythraea TaxID=1836 RepID=A0ABN1EEV9_SACER|nr:hypothetical protein N599_32600 [Saccharopolyspora erythraea D]